MQHQKELLVAKEVEGHVCKLLISRTIIAVDSYLQLKKKQPIIGKKNKTARARSYNQKEQLNLLRGGFLLSVQQVSSHGRRKKSNGVGRVRIKRISTPVVPHIIMYKVVVRALYNSRRMSAINVRAHYESLCCSSEQRALHIQHEGEARGQVEYHVFSPCGTLTRSLALQWVYCWWERWE